MESKHCTGYTLPPYAMYAMYVTLLAGIFHNRRQAVPSQGTTAIERLIVIVGENHTFDNAFGIITRSDPYLPPSPPATGDLMHLYSVAFSSDFPLNQLKQSKLIQENASPLFI